MTSGEPFVLLIWSSGLQNEEDGPWSLSTSHRNFLSQISPIFILHMKERKNSVWWKSWSVPQLHPGTANDAQAWAFSPRPPLTTEAKGLWTWLHSLNASLNLLAWSPSCQSCVLGTRDLLLLGTTPPSGNCSQHAHSSEEAWFEMNKCFWILKGHIWELFHRQAYSETSVLILNFKTIMWHFDIWQREMNFRLFQTA